MINNIIENNIIKNSTAADTIIITKNKKTVATINILIATNLDIIGAIISSQISNLLIHLTTIYHNINYNNHNCSKSNSTRKYIK